MPENTSTSAGRQLRSPNFPSLTLQKAIERAKVIYTHEKRFPAVFPVIAKHWGSNPKSSAAMQALAALSSFGLVVITGKGDDRQVKLSDRALDIIERSAESPERVKAIKDAAFAPTIHAEMWEKYGKDLPSDSNIREFLLREKKFNPASVSSFLAKYRETLSFANPNDAATITEESGVDADLESDEFGGAEPIGSAGGAKPKQQEKRKQPMAGTEEAVFPLVEGAVVVQWPTSISPESYEDFEGYMQLIMRRVKRSIKPPG